MSQFHSHKAQALLVADPDASPDLLAFARNLLNDGGTGAKSVNTSGSGADYEDLIGPFIRDIVDLVVILRTENSPSREVGTASKLAKAHGKPIHALVERGVACGLDVDEMHSIEIDPSWDGRQELYRWGAGLAERYGRPSDELEAP